MIEHKTSLRPRYAETDRMGYAYYGRFAEYFEVARTEFIRELACSYLEFEEKHRVMLPVVELHINYKKPALYDEEIIIKSTIKDKPGTKITFCHEVYNAASELLTTGHVTLVFVSASTRRPCRPPAFFIQAIEEKWQS